MLAVVVVDIANVLFGNQPTHATLLGYVLRTPPTPLRALGAVRGQRVAIQAILEARVTQEGHLLGYLEHFPVGRVVMPVVAVLEAVAAQEAVLEGMDFLIAVAHKVVRLPQAAEVLEVMGAEVVLLDAPAPQLFLVGAELAAAARAPSITACPR